MFIAISKPRAILHDFLAFPGHYIYPESVSDEGKEHYNICSEHFDATIKTFVRKTLIISTSAFIAAALPFYQSLWWGIQITAMDLKIPFIEEESFAEFLVNIFLECNILTHGFVAYLSIEVGMDIVTDFVAISQKLLEYQLQIMFNQRKGKRSADAVSMLGDIIRRLRDFDK